MSQAGDTLSPVDTPGIFKQDDLGGDSLIADVELAGAFVGAHLSSDERWSSGAGPAPSVIAAANRLGVAVVSEAGGMLTAA